MPFHRKFDDLTRALAGGISRRGLTRSLAAVLPGLALASADADSENRQRGKGGGAGGKSKPKARGKKHKLHKSRTPTPPPPHMGPPDECDTTWPGADQQGQRDHCRFIRGQCKVGVPREFCIRDGTKPDGTPTQVADCCGETQKCCGRSCCDKDASCCDGRCCGNPPDFGCCGGRCFNLKVSTKHCGACGNTCGAEQTCRDAKCGCDDSQCLSGATCCGEGCCGGPNFPDHRCCDSQCLNTGRDPRNCGLCGNTCAAGQICRDGHCVCNEAACPHGQLCLDDAGFSCSNRGHSGCRCWCGPHYKYCPNQFGGACVSPNAVCA